MSFNNCELELKSLLMELNTMNNEWQQQKDEIENNNQELFNVQRETIELTARESAYIEELTFLKQEDERQCKKLSEGILSAEDLKRKLLKDQHRIANAVQNQIFLTDQEIQKCVKQIQVLQQIRYNNLSSKENEIEKDIEEEILSISEEINALQTQYDNKSKENCILSSKLKEVEEELEHLQETLQYTTEQLQSDKENVEKLKSEVAAVQVEIDSKKSVPLEDASRGNSLFAEVHDKKIELESKYLSMKAHYAELKVEHSDLMKQIKTVSAEKALLSDIHQADMKQEKEQFNMWLHYDAQIDKLKAEYIEKKKLFENKFECICKDISLEDVKALQNFYTAKEKRLLRVLDDVCSYSERQLQLSKQVANLNDKVRGLNFDISQLESETSMLTAARNSLCQDKNINPICECKKEA